MAPRTGDARILTVPNVISFVRLLCIPVFVWLLFGRHHRAGASAMLGVLGGTDWIDGWIARRFDQGSTLGKILDPAADRLLLGVGVIAIIIDHSVPLWIGVIVVFREVAISIVTVVLAALGARRIDVQWVGKAGTFALMVAFPFFLASHSTYSWRGFARWAAWAWIVPAIVLSYWAAITYIPLGKRALQEGRAARLGSVE
jgi:cardiolipin synthase (CMP-forming)